MKLKIPTAVFACLSYIFIASNLSCAKHANCADITSSISIAKLTYNSGDTLQANGITNTTGVNNHWKLPNGETVSGNTLLLPAIQYDQSGTYTFVVEYLDCIVEKEIEVYVKQASSICSTVALNRFNRTFYSSPLTLADSGDYISGTHYVSFSIPNAGTHKAQELIFAFKKPLKDISGTYTIVSDIYSLGYDNQVSVLYVYDCDGQSYKQAVNPSFPYGTVTASQTDGYLYLQFCSLDFFEYTNYTKEHTSAYMRVFLSNE